jgi:hypothetical protein
MPEILTDFERGVRSGVDKLDEHFRNDDRHLTIEVRVERPDGSADHDLRSLTDADMTAYRESAIRSALQEERAQATSKPIVTTAHDAELSQVMEFMATDKSNDWSEEIAVLANVESELLEARDKLQTYYDNIGSLGTIVTMSRYARLGKFTAALLGSHEEWPGSEMLEWIAEQWGRIDSTHSIAGQNAAELQYWRKIADRLGIEYDGELDDEDED